MFKLNDIQMSLGLQVTRRSIVMAQGGAGGPLMEDLGMAPVRLEALVRAMESVKVRRGRNAEVSALVWDSRQAVKGCVFFAIKGEKQDGNAFVAEAIRKGAIAVVSEDLSLARKDVCTIEVRDVRRALAQAARLFYRRPDEQLHLVGVTGTNGKTTVSRIVKHLLDGGEDRCGLIGTIAYIVGERVLPARKTTPEADEVCALLGEMVVNHCTHASMEVSSHGIMQHRVFGLHFDTMVFLNLTQDHLDFHGDMESYFRAKASMFDGSRNPLPTHAVINTDDPYGVRLAAMIDPSVRVFTTGCVGDPDFRAEDIHVSANGTSFRLVSPDGVHLVKSPLIGSFNVSNLLAGIACAYAAGLKVAHILPLLAKLPSVPGRMESVREGQSFLAVVDYAHTPDALDKLLSTVNALVEGNVKVVFGCGGDRDRGKRSQMMEVVCRYASEVWATSDNPRTERQSQIFADMMKGVDRHTRVHFIEDRELAIREALESAEHGDAVVIAGKGHEAYQEINHTVIPFDDRQVTRAVLKGLNFC